MVRKMCLQIFIIFYGCKFSIQIIYFSTQDMLLLFIMALIQNSTTEFFTPSSPILFVSSINPYPFLFLASENSHFSFNAYYINDITFHVKKPILNLPSRASFILLNIMNDVCFKACCGS